MPPVTSAVTFGFGLGHPAVPSPTRASPSATQSTSKRQRSISPDEESDSGASYALPKRMRAGIGIGVGAMSPGRRRGESTPSPSANLADVGKMLATLDKASLLTVFSRLLATDPHIADRIQPLIPTPSISSVESALEESHRTVRSLAANAGEMRAEFAWGRLRNPIADFVTSALGFLPFFIAEEGARDPPHPSTTFGYLLLVTERAQQLMAQVPVTPGNMSASLFCPDARNPVITSHTSGTPKMVLKVYQDALSSSDKLSALNPNAIVSQLIPSMLLQWAHLADSIARAVNEEGRMFGGEMVRGWLGSLESLTQEREANGEEEKEEEKACRLALFAVGQRMQEQIGWLVGRHPSSRSMGHMEF